MLAAIVRRILSSVLCLHMPMAGLAGLAWRAMAIHVAGQLPRGGGVLGVSADGRSDALCS